MDLLIKIDSDINTSQMKISKLESDSELVLHFIKNDIAKLEEHSNELEQIIFLENEDSNVI